MIDWGNVRMIKKRCELGFLLKTHAIEFRGKEHLSQHLQCHRPSQTCVRGFVDHAHPPAGNLALHSIVAKGGREIDRREGRLNWLRVIESQTGKSTNKSTGRAGKRSAMRAYFSTASGLSTVKRSAAKSADRVSHFNSTAAMDRSTSVRAQTRSKACSGE